MLIVVEHLEIPLNCKGVGISEFPKVIRDLLTNRITTNLTLHKVSLIADLLQ